MKASGVSWLGGIVTIQSIQSGVINHALAIHVGTDDLAPRYVWPAVEFDENGASTYRGTLPMGTRLGIPWGVPRPAGMSPLGNMIFAALQRYGGYVVDRNQSFNIPADANTVPVSLIQPVRQTTRDRPSDLAKIVPLIQVVR